MFSSYRPFLVLIKAELRASLLVVKAPGQKVEDHEFKSHLSHESQLYDLG